MKINLCNILIIRKLLFLFLTLSLASCLPHQVPSERPPARVMARAALDPAAQLNMWYNNTVQNCGSDTRPAFLCSGVMLRITSVNPNYLPWDPSPSGISKGGISFSWLRADDNFKNFVYNEGNGMIFYPAEVIPAGKQTSINTLCAFPVDGGTFDRSDQGCGIVASSPQTDSCEKLNITTAAQWIAHYRSGYQCSWNVRPDTPGNAAHFSEYIESRRLLGSDLWNEFMLATWQTGSGATMPIHSFFYLTGNAQYLSYAHTYQQKYYDNYRQFIPIVKVTLPANFTGKTTFTYSEADQVVKIRPVESLTPLTPQATGTGGTTLTRTNYVSLDALTVQVPQYEGMAAGDNVSLRWQGRTAAFEAEAKAVTTPGTLTFTVPRAEVLDSTGTTATLIFSVKRSGSIVTELSAPLSLIIEAQPLNLDAPVLSDDYRTASVSYVGMSTQDSITLHWAGAVLHNTAAQTGNADGSIVFDIPAEWISESRGREVQVSYTVKSAADPQPQFSQLLRTTVNNEIEDLHPSVQEASGNNGTELRQEDYYTLQSLTVQVPEYRDMTAGDEVNVVWKGPAHIYTTDSIKVILPGALTFSIPRPEFLDTIGSSATISFVVRRNGQVVSESSDTFTLFVDGQQLTLFPPSLTADNRTVTVAYDGMRGSDSVAVHWSGPTEHVTGTSLGNDQGSLAFVIPTSWVRESLGHEVLVSYTVQTSTGAQYQFSRLKRVTIEEGSDSEIEDLVPRAIEATGNNGSLLTRADYHALPSLTVQVPSYKNMLSGDRVRVRWSGRAHEYVTAEQTVTEPGALTFSLPRAEFIDTIGGSAAMSFEVWRSGSTQSEISGRKLLTVEAQPLNLPVVSISDDLRSVIVEYKDMSVTDAITVYWDGVASHATTAVSGSADGSEVFIIPASWVKENTGREVLVSYTVQTADETLMQYSHILRVIPAVLMSP